MSFRRISPSRVSGLIGGYLIRAPLSLPKKAEGFSSKFWLIVDSFELLMGLVLVLLSPSQMHV